jgi:bifunctional non-homologous end joining protein LigD
MRKLAGKGRATRNHHPAVHLRRATPGRNGRRAAIPEGVDSAEVRVGGRVVSLTNLRKPFWPKLGVTKGDLLRYYAAIAPVLLPHLRDRAMMMKRYPNGADGDFFFMKRAPSPRPDWIELCSIRHRSENVIDFPMVQDLASLLWVVNLGCIDLNPWYARCDDVDRPDFLHFDLDPVPPAKFQRVIEAALMVRESIADLGMSAYAKTTGSKGIHIYVPIARGPTQKQVWTVAKQIAQTLAVLRPNLITAEYRIAKRPAGRVLVDYNQNAWGRTLASVYSVRPRPLATVSAPVSWKELERGVKIEDFRIDNVLARVKAVGDLWKPVRAGRGRFILETLWNDNRFEKNSRA